VESFAPHVWTYFIQAGPDGDIKIGISQDPESRRRTLQTGNARQLVILAAIAGDFERHFHHRFRRFRLNGEWFRGEPVRQYLNSEEFKRLCQRQRKPLGFLDKFLRSHGEGCAVVAILLLVAFLVLLPFIVIFVMLGMLFA
jgi:hypothetical protein